MKKNFTNWVAFIFYFFVVVVNFLANALPINNLSTGEISELYPNLFTPAGIIFSIWGVIYLLLFGYVFYQLGFFQKKVEERREKLFQKINPYFIISSIANIFWIFAWHHTLAGFSVVLMLVLLFSLIKIANILKEENLPERKDKFFILLPFSIYLGWIMVATIANITAFLVSIKWDGFGIREEIWTTIILVIGAFIGVFRMFKDKNILYGIVFVWTYFGIWLKHTSLSGFAGNYPIVIFTTLSCIVFLLIAQLLISLKKENKN